MAFEEVVRPAVAPPASPGFRPPASLGVNAAPPNAAYGSDVGATDTGPFARKDIAEDYQNFPQLRKLLAGGLEIASNWRAVSGTFQINPNVCGIWRLRCYTPSLALTFAALDPMPESLVGTIWANAQRVATIEIKIDWMVAAGDERVLTLAGVRFADGEKPIWTPIVGRDVLMVQLTSDGDNEGFPVSLDAKVPT